MISIEKLKKWYPRLWTLEMMKNAIAKSAITVEDFKEVTGKDYE